MPSSAHDQPVIVPPAGTGNETAVPGASDGPTLDTVTVYVVEVPAVTDVTPSEFVTTMSADGSNVSVSLAESLPESASVTPVGAAMSAVFVIVPVAAGSIVDDDAEGCGAPDRDVDTLGDRAGAGGRAARATGGCRKVHVIEVAPAGNASVTVAPTTSDGPVGLVTTMS